MKVVYFMDRTRIEIFTLTAIYFDCSCSMNVLSFWVVRLIVSYRFLSEIFKATSLLHRIIGNIGKGFIADVDQAGLARM